MRGTCKDQRASRRWPSMAAATGPPLAGMTENSVLAGYQDNTLRASAQITRAETAPLIAKLL